MPKLTRRSLLRNFFGVLAGRTVARPYIANAAAKSATAWWVQGYCSRRRRGVLKTLSPTEHNRQRSQRLVRLLPNRPMTGKTASCMLTIRCRGGGDQDAHVSDHRLQERLRTAGSDQLERCRRQQRLLREVGHGPRWHDFDRGRDAVTREERGLRRHRHDGRAAVQ
jgi:hypothetical protein